MCTTCGLLLLDACPSAPEVRERDVDDDLTREQEIDRHRTRAARPVLDVVTELALRARLTRPDMAGRTRSPCS